MKIIRSLGAIALASLVVVTTASAEERGYSAALCSSNTTNTFFEDFGINVVNLSPATVFCGAAPIVGADVNRIQAAVYDRNSTGDVCCTMLVLGADGMPISSASRCSTGSSSSVQTLSVVPPVNAAGSVLLSCNVPPATPSGFSRVSVYRVRSSP